MSVRGELSGEVSSDVEVSYATSDGTAGSTDYTAVSATTLTFTAGQTEKTVTVATTEDDLTEADETFTVSLTVPDGVTLPDGVSVDADKDEATGTILDDDALTVSVAGPDANVEEGQTATFTVTVTGGTSTAAVEVSYEVDTVASTATATDDYTAPSGTVLTIGAGVASGTIDIVTKTDAVLEPDETLVLKLTGVSTAGEAERDDGERDGDDRGHGRGEGVGGSRRSRRGRRGEVRGEGCPGRYRVTWRCRTRPRTGPRWLSTDYTAVAATTSDVHGRDRRRRR